jgi:hypothetical protein
MPVKNIIQDIGDRKTITKAFPESVGSTVKLRELKSEDVVDTTRLMTTQRLQFNPPELNLVYAKCFLGIVIT